MLPIRFLSLNKKCTKSGWYLPVVFSLAFWLTVVWLSPVSAQRVVSKVTVILKQLPEKKQAELVEFYRVVETYINSFDWIEDDQGGEFKISMQFLLMEASVSGESRYRANLLVSNEKDIQYFDKRCKFAYQTNDALYHNSSQVNSLTTLIDFYVYMILGHEFDKLSRYGGDFYFKLAQERTEQGRFGLSHFVEGWDYRQKDINRVLNENYKPYRLMKDIFFYGVYLYDDKNEKAKGRKYVFDAIKRIEEGVERMPVNEDYGRFLKSYSSLIIQIFKNSKSANPVFKTLIRIDPDHKTTYEQFVQPE